jgi:hypothetical protein
LIVVNLTYPERNREVQLYCFEGLADKEGTIVDGFQVVMPIDIRDFDFKLFKLEIVEDYELLLHMPSLPHQMQYELTKRHAKLIEMNLDCPKCAQAQEICVTGIKDNPSRKIKKLRLRFPEDSVCLVNLSSGLDKVITPTIEPYSYETDLYGDPEAAVQWVSSISWKIGNSLTTRKTFEGSAKKAESQLSSLFKKQCRT